MRDKSFMYCVIGILLVIAIGEYVHWHNSGIRTESDAKDAIMAQVKNFDVNDISDTYKIQIGANEIWSDGMNIPDDFVTLLPCIDFEQLNESELENKINDTLEYASTSWITEDIANAYSNVGYFQVYCHTKNYLSVGQTYGTREAKHIHTIEDYITIDMNSGERVFLDDILDVDKLCDFLLEGDQYFALRTFSLDSQEADESIRSEVKKYSKCELKNMLKQCSMEQKEFYNWFCESQRGKQPALHQRANFYLKNTQLVIILEDETAMHPGILINYKDLDGVLKEDFKNRMVRG